MLIVMADGLDHAHRIQLCGTATVGSHQASRDPPCCTTVTLSRMVSGISRSRLVFVESPVLAGSHHQSVFRLPKDRSFGRRRPLFGSEDVSDCKEFLVSMLISWKCGCLATRVCEASHPGPLDILGAALAEAHPSHDQTPFVQDVGASIDPTASGSVPPQGTAPPPLPVPGSALRRLAPQDCTQPPLSELHASSAGQWYCQVPSFPDHCPLSSVGWSSLSAMKGHRDRRLGGYLDGDLPLEWLQELDVGFARLAIGSFPPGSAVDAHHAGLHSLSPNLGHPQGVPSPMACHHLRRSSAPVPASDPRSPLGAQDLRSTCLNAALADSRWDKPHLAFHQRDQASMSGLAERVRLELWDPPPKRTSTRDPRKGQKETTEPSFGLDDHTAARVHTLISEGALHRACTALTSEPPVIPTSEVVDELRRLHPGPTASHLEEINKLRAVSPGAVPAVDPDMVRKALASFAPASGAGPSGLKPSHFQEALRYSSGDQTRRLLWEVLQMMLRGEIPEDTRTWVCGASLMALRVPSAWSL